MSNPSRDPRSGAYLRKNSSTDLSQSSQLTVWLAVTNAERGLGTSERKIAATVPICRYEAATGAVSHIRRVSIKPTEIGHRAYLRDRVAAERVLTKDLLQSHDDFREVQRL